MAGLLVASNWVMAWPRNVNGFCSIKNSPSVRAERNRLDGCADAARNALHHCREVLVKMNGLIDQAVLFIEALLFFQRLLGHGCGEDLVCVLLRVQPQHGGG